MNRLGAHARVALAHHCRLGVETVHPRFSWVDVAAGFSYVLTVNTGYE